MIREPVGFKQYLLPIAALLLFLIAAMPLQAARILVIGDSWGVAARPALQAALINNGSLETVNSIAVGGETAENLNTPAGFQEITTALEENPDATLVHLSIGGNDFLGTWNATFSASQENELIAGILADITAIIDHILEQRPAIRVYWSSYDFPRPLIIGTPEQVNKASMRFSMQAQALAESKGAALSYGDFNGLTQVAYGFDGVQVSPFDPAMPIPAGDASLPDPKYPGPAPAYTDLIHLTAEAYLLLAEAQYQQFYQAALAGFQINAGLNDAWYNPDTDGQGFFITVFPELGLVSLAWFTYDTELPAMNAKAQLGDPGHRWLTALGTFVDNQSVMDIDFTSGGRFDTATEIQHTEPVGSDGTIILTFTDCNTGTVEYDIPSIGRKGTVPIKRIARDNIALCEALQQVAGSE